MPVKGILKKKQHSILNVHLSMNQNNKVRMILYNNQNLKPTIIIAIPKLLCLITNVDTFPEVLWL